MPTSVDIIIGNPETQHLAIRPLGRAHPGLFDFWDGHWIDCQVSISAGGFQGRFRADLRSEEFQGFLAGVEALGNTLEGSARLTSMEGQIDISLTGDGKGRIQVAGEAVDEAGIGNHLPFQFELDQTFLPEISRSLERFLVAFPVLARRNRRSLPPPISDGAHRGPDSSRGGGSPGDSEKGTAMSSKTFRTTIVREGGCASSPSPSIQKPFSAKPGRRAR